MNDTLKNLLSSVDWSTLANKSDVRNAAIGSALGGLMLGGAGLMRERDPEESKMAPVGDALMGALLGGVAGYGIPKGLSMFADSGSMAPPDDRLNVGYLDAAKSGAKGGAILAGATMVPPALRASVKSLSDRLALNALYDSRGLSGRKVPLSGFWRDIARNMANEKPVAALPKGTKLLSLRRAIHGIRSAFNGSQYRVPSGTRGIMAAGPKMKMIAKGGKYAAGGAALAMLSHMLFGPSARDNTKN